MKDNIWDLILLCSAGISLKILDHQDWKVWSEIFEKMKKIFNNYIQNQIVEIRFRITNCFSWSKILEVRID